MAAKMRFKLGTWNKGAVINGKDVGTGFLVIELDNTVNIKTLFKTRYLFMLSDVKEAVLNKKEINITTHSGDVFNLWAKPDDLSALERLIKSQKGAA
jgi:hypothetical protein